MSSESLISLAPFWTYSLHNFLTFQDTINKEIPAGTPIFIFLGFQEKSLFASSGIEEKRWREREKS
ncbi:hypothetical protein D4R42_00670 [bacterium]|nr:MAG: hypothetical protein D4R42_00670 [bacterium]